MDALFPRPSLAKPLFLLACLVSGTAGAADAASAAQLAKARNCMTCHLADSPLMGPSFKEIAGRYRGQPDSEASVVQRVMKGSKGVWGSVPMPSNNQVSEEEARILVKWILAR